MVLCVTSDLYARASGRVAKKRAQGRSLTITCDTVRTALKRSESYIGPQHIHLQIRYASVIQLRYTDKVSLRYGSFVGSCDTFKYMQSRYGYLSVAIQSVALGCVQHKVAKNSRMALCCQNWVSKGTNQCYGLHVSACISVHSTLVTVLGLLKKKEKNWRI